MTKQQAGSDPSTPKRWASRRQSYLDVAHKKSCGMRKELPNARQNSSHVRILTGLEKLARTSLSVTDTNVMWTAEMSVPQTCMFSQLSSKVLKQWVD